MIEKFENMPGYYLINVEGLDSDGVDVKAQVNKNGEFVSGYVGTEDGGDIEESLKFLDEAEANKIADKIRQSNPQLKITVVSPRY